MINFLFFVLTIILLLITCSKVETFIVFNSKNTNINSLIKDNIKYVKNLVNKSISKTKKVIGLDKKKNQTFQKEFNEMKKENLERQINNKSDSLETICMLRILYYKNAKYHNGIVNMCLEEFKENLEKTLQPVLSDTELDEIKASFSEEKTLLQIKYQGLQKTLLETGYALKIDRADYVKLFTLASGKPILKSKLVIDNFYDNFDDSEIENIYTECISSIDPKNLFGNKHREEVILNTSKDLRVYPPDRIEEMKSKRPWYTKLGVNLFDTW